MKKENLLLLVVFIVLISTSCRKVREGVETTVKGYVIDTIKNKRLPNATVIIKGCHWAAGTGQTYCTDSILVTKTNLNGEFEINFSSDGKNTGYEASVLDDRNYVNFAHLRLNPGKVNSIVLKALETNYLKLQIKIINNPYDTIRIGGSIDKHVLYGRANDTALYFKVLPNTSNYILYSIWDRKIGLYRRLHEPIQIKMQDTTIYNKTISNTEDLPYQR